MAEPTDSALLVFRGADSSVAAEFDRNDPYILYGLVASWEVRPWSVVVGTEYAAAGGVMA